jgi:hypothetical protein
MAVVGSQEEVVGALTRFVARSLSSLVGVLARSFCQLVGVACWRARE